MVAAAAATAGSSATADATAAADSVVIASANAFILATSDMRSFIWLSCMHIMHGPLPEGLPSWTKVHSKHSQGIVVPENDTNKWGRVCCVTLLFGCELVHTHSEHC